MSLETQGFLIIAAVVLSIGAAVWTRYRQSSVWKKVARKLGLGISDTGFSSQPSIYGEFRGRNVSVQTEIVGSGKNKAVYTVVQAPFTGLAPSGLLVYREGFAQKMGKMFGGEDIQIGDPELDDTFIIRGNSSREVSDLLTTPSVKRALLIGIKRSDKLRLEASAVRIRAGGRTTNAERLESYIRTVVDVALCINEACLGPEDDSPEAVPDEPFGRAVQPSTTQPSSDQSTPAAAPEPATQPPPATQPTQQTPVGVDAPAGADAAETDKNDWW